MKKLFKRFEEYRLPKKNLVVERIKFFWKNLHDDEIFDQFMAELRNIQIRRSTWELAAVKSSAWDQIGQNQRCSTEERGRDDTGECNQYMPNSRNKKWKNELED